MNSLLKFLIYAVSNVCKSRFDEDETDSGHEEESEAIEDDNDSDVAEEDDNDHEEVEEEDYVEPKISRRQAEIIKLRHERQEADKKYEKAREELEAVRRQPVERQSITQEETLRKQEDAILNNPDATDWQRYSVQSARDSRSAIANSQVALREARDINDKTAFSKIYKCTTGITTNRRC